MVKTGLRIKIASNIFLVKEARQARDAAPIQKKYLAVLGRLTKDIDASLEEVGSNPEEGVAIARECTRLMLEAVPDPAYDPGRASALNQFRTLESCLAEIRKPKKYLADLQIQYGVRLNPLNYPEATDAVKVIIDSQRRKIHIESKGLNTIEEKDFCLKRSELLGVIEKAYYRLRDKALGRGPKNVSQPA